MGDSQDSSKAQAPAWQRAQANPDAAVGADSQTASLEHARRFLQDPDVKKETIERKTEFLKNKGLSQSDIDELLKNESPSEKEAYAEPQTEPGTVGQEKATPAETVSRPPPTPQTTIQLTERKEDRPPIVTYPEFLTKPTRPPPLVTVNGFLNTVYAFSGFATLVYGTSKFVLEPMVHSLTEARISLHDTAKQDLTKLVAKLESVVSELPPTNPKPEHHDDNATDDALSSYDDPTELFHRDIGVQTSLPASPVSAVPPRLTPSEKPSAQQARRLKELVGSVKAVSEGLVGENESYEEVKGVLDVLRDELDVLSVAHVGHDYGYSYGAANRNEPDDEIKKAKENIRRVKGVLLSSRSFPASTR